MNYNRSMNYKYDIMCIIESPKIYLEGSVCAPSFTSALFSFMETRNIVSSTFLIYCRKEKSGDLQLMGKYDGASFVLFRGLKFTHILSTKDNKDYSFSSDGFRRIYIK